MPALAAIQPALRVCSTVLQVSLLSGVWLTMDALRNHFSWSMPAGLLGFLLVAAGLFSGLIKPRWMQLGTQWLMAEMLLFFVPAILVIRQYPELIASQGLRILAVVVLSTLCVMAVTALAVDRVHRLELWLARRQRSRRRNSTESAQ